MFSKTTIALLFATLANAVADDCPFAEGTYKANTYITKEGRVAVFGCYVDEETNQISEYNSDRTKSSRICENASCNNVAAKVFNLGDVCEVTIDSCFSNTNDGVPRSFTFSYENFAAVNVGTFAVTGSNIIVQNDLYLRFLSKPRATDSLET